jgi:predicted RNase H-like nuclease (RuvC/YqgF family)
MSEFREYYKKIPVDIRQSFGSTSKTAEYVYDGLQKEIKSLEQKLKEAERRVEALKESVVNAYECGHNDTVESNYCDPEERAAEIIEEALEEMSDKKL